MQKTYTGKLDNIEEKETKKGDALFILVFEDGMKITNFKTLPDAVAGKFYDVVYKETKKGEWTNRNLVSIEEAKEVPKTEQGKLSQPQSDKQEQKPAVTSAVIRLPKNVKSITLVFGDE